VEERLTKIIIEIDDMVYITTGKLGKCEARGCTDEGVTYNEDGVLLCEEHLIEWHENQRDDPKNFPSYLY
jgi:hypothetical protein